MPFLTTQIQSEKAKSLVLQSLKCLAEYANLRPSFFLEKASKSQYIVNFVNLLVKFTSKDHRAQNPHMISLLSNVSIFRETLKVISRFHDNFGIRAILACEVDGLLRAYL